MTQSFPLPRCLPETVGIPSSAVTAFLHAADNGNHGLHSFMLLRRGQVAAEAWWQPYGADRPHMMFSLSKSFTSTAVGFAVSEGLLTVDDPVVSFFPEREKADDEHLRAMRVRHLLSMSSGHAKETMDSLHKRKDGDWVQAFLELPVEHEPGTHFVYNSGASYMLSAIVQQVTGQTVHDYLGPRLFEPLGIRGSFWETCPRGISAGGWGLNLVTEDIARFGQLYLQKGVWNGRRLLPEAWVEEATSWQVANDSANVDWRQGYGYQFWRCQHGAYRGDGAFGQFCIVMPEQEAVIAITSGTKSMQNVLNLVWEHLLPAMREGTLPADSQSQHALAACISSLAYEPLGGDCRSPLEETVAAHRYVLDGNVRGIESGSFRFDGDGCVVTFRSKQGDTDVRCGFGSWQESYVPHFNRKDKVFASSQWTAPDTLVLRWLFVETPFADTLTFRFDGDRVEFVLASDVRFGNPPPLVMNGVKETAL